MERTPTSKNDKEIIRQFFTKRKSGLRNPLVSNFLKDEENYKKVKRAILDPTKKNVDTVECLFKKHYEEVVKIKYISNLIHFFSIDYDKRYRRLNEQSSLTLDQEINEEDTTFKDMLKSNYKVATSLYDSISEFTDNKTLIKGLKSLTKNQLQIIELIYLKGLKLKEIAHITGTTPQNISNQHRKSLNKLYNFMREVDENTRT